VNLTWVKNSIRKSSKSNWQFRSRESCTWLGSSSCNDSNRITTFSLFSYSSTNL